MRRKLLLSRGIYKELFVIYVKNQLPLPNF